MRIQDLSIKIKILFIVALALIMVTTLLSIINISGLTNLAGHLIVEKSRSIVNSSEAIRDEMARKIKLGVVRDFDDLAAEGNDEKLLAAVPIITAIRAADMNKDDGNYEFRVPKVSPRNPENTPTEQELIDLEKIKSGNLDEYFYFDRENHELRYYRPIRLTEDCLYCHGDPKGTKDPLGGIKEGWKTGEIHGAFEIITPLTIQKAEARKALIFMIIVGGGILLIVGSIIWITINIITKPLNSYVDKFKQASRGDLTVTAEVKSKDEIGKLSIYFNDFMQTLKETMGTITGVTDQTKMISSDLASSTEQSAAAITEIQANTESMKSQMGNLDKEVSDSTRTAEEVKEYISGVAELIASQASAITESSASIEEMSASIQNIARVSEEKLQVANELRSISQSGEEEMTTTVEFINKVARSADTIMELSEVIQSITSQTDLLAMNAAIEAAHAGEAGKGFSVVADEIRDLAESSANSVKEITESLTQIIEYIHISEESTKKTGLMFGNMIKKISEMADSMNELKNSTTELSLGSEQILTALSSLIDITTNVQDSSQDMDAHMIQIADSMTKLSSLSSQTASGMEEIVLGISEISESAQNVQRAGDQNSSNVNKLEELMSQFKTDKE